MEQDGGAPQIPLVDGNGSTIAMVDSASGGVASTYSYDPFGKVTIGGSGYETAYQYLGMENETLIGATWAYYGGGTYYSPVLGRPLTIEGPITSAGGFNPGFGGTVAPARPGSGGSSGNAVKTGIGLAVTAIALWYGISPLDDDMGFSVSPTILGSLINDIFNLFGLFGGGGPSLSPHEEFELTHVGGSPTTWAPIYGLPPDYPPNQGKSAPSPSQYAQWGRSANWLENLVNLYDFRRGGSLDAQAYGASPAYGRYVFGVYMAGHGYSLSTTLYWANEYGYWRSHYGPNTPMGGPKYPSIPAAEVTEITKGFNDERNGNFGLP